MRTVRILGLILLLSSISVKTEAQITCPPNIDFELGTLSNWNFGTGLFTTVASLTTGVTTGPAIACRHTLTRATGLVGCAGGATDPIGGFPVLAPGSGSYSFRLGNSSTGRQIDRATYYVNVPAGFSNFSMIYRYATVLQDPSHSAAQQPRFVVRAFDSATLSPVPCANYNYVATASMPGFISVGSVRYLPWSTGALDLSGMGGTTVAIEFTTADCSLGGHYGYAYIDLQCGLFQIMTTSCDTLTPPHSKRTSRFSNIHMVRFVYVFHSLWLYSKYYYSHSSRPHYLGCDTNTLSWLWMYGYVIYTSDSCSHGT